MSEIEPEIVIQDRPQISVTRRSDGLIEILTARIGDDFQMVEHDSVLIPPDCAREVGEALLRLAE